MRGVQDFRQQIGGGKNEGSVKGAAKKWALHSKQGRSEPGGDHHVAKDAKTRRFSPSLTRNRLNSKDRAKKVSNR